MLAVVFWSGHCLACDYTEIMSQVFYASTGRCPELAHIWRSLVFRELDLSLTYAQRNDVFVWVLPLHLGCSTGMYVRTAGLLLPAPEEYLGASFLLLPSFNEGSMGVLHGAVLPGNRMTSGVELVPYKPGCRRTNQV